MGSKIWSDIILGVRVFLDDHAGKLLFILVLEIVEQSVPQACLLVILL